MATRTAVFEFTVKRCNPQPRHSSIEKLSSIDCESSKLPPARRRRVAPTLPLVAIGLLAAAAPAAAKLADVQSEEHGESVEKTTVAVKDGGRYTHQASLDVGHAVSAESRIRFLLERAPDMSAVDRTESLSGEKVANG